MKISRKRINLFQKKIYDYYSRSGRLFPWRETNNPYNILVSEIMLQQTQVTRVISKYQQFLNEFPDVNKLAAAPLTHVLKAWSGLGYNRRAKYLRESANMIVKNFADRKSVV